MKVTYPFNVIAAPSSTTMLDEFLEDNGFIYTRLSDRLFRVTPTRDYPCTEAHLMRLVSMATGFSGFNIKRDIAALLDETKEAQRKHMARTRGLP